MSTFKTIHFHLDDFEFAQAKKLVKIEGGATFQAQRDDLFPFIKYHEPVTVKPAKTLMPYLPVAYLEGKSIKLGFINNIVEDKVFISTVKGFPQEWPIQSKYILGRVNFIFPNFWFKFKLKRHLKKEKYRLIR